MSFYLRKSIKSADKGWRFIYLKGIKFNKIPQEILNDERILQFSRFWGDGPYEFIGTGKGRKVVERFKITTLGFRAMADQNGQPIRSSCQSRPKTSSRPHSKQTTQTPPSKQTAPMPSPRQTGPTLPPMKSAPKPPQPKPSPRSPPKQRTPLQTQQSSMPPTIPMNRSSPRQSHGQAQPTQAPIQSTSPAPEKPPPPPLKIAPPPEPEKRKLVLNRCIDCKTYVQWFLGENVLYCPVCAAEYETGYACPDCGTKVAPEATRCPNCSKLRAEGEVEEIYVRCFNCETGVKWAQEECTFYCPSCEVEYITMRACPSCGTEITIEATVCSECRKGLEDGEGEFMYPLCPAHEIPMEWSHEDGFFCLECMPDPDLEEDDEEIYECPACSAKVTSEDEWCPKCGQLRDECEDEEEMNEDEGE